MADDRDALELDDDERAAYARPFLDDGVLALDGDRLAFRSDAVRWSIPVEHIRLIACATIEAWPAQTDWFLVVLTGTDGRWHEASLYAEGVDDAIGDLGRRLNAPELRAHDGELDKLRIGDHLATVVRGRSALRLRRRPAAHASRRLAARLGFGAGTCLQSIRPVILERLRDSDDVV